MEGRREHRCTVRWARKFDVRIEVGSCQVAELLWSAAKAPSRSRSREKARSDVEVERPILRSQALSWAFGLQHSATASCSAAPTPTKVRPLRPERARLPCESEHSPAADT